MLSSELGLSQCCFRMKTEPMNSFQKKVFHETRKNEAINQYLKPTDVSFFDVELMGVIVMLQGGVT